MTEPTHYLIPAALLGATLDYLSKRPYIEVADAVAALRILEPAPSSGVTVGAPPEPDSPSTSSDDTKATTP